jgi:glyoxylase-like metal-dependent hydrolase (beta-lactamase superfamily II)
MPIHIFNGFTCNARWPSTLKTGTVCMLVETEQGLVLIDTGPGIDDYAHPHVMLKIFRIITELSFDPHETAINQIRQLGYRPEEVHHIILTHMHFDHCGGLPDFPWARVHVHRREFEAFTGKMRRWTDMAYVQRHIAHVTNWVFYHDGDERWYDFKAIRLPFTPEMWLVPLHGHSWGHCGVAVKTEKGWYFNAADAGAVHNNETPAWLIKLILGPHDARLRQFMSLHPEVVIFNSHMFPEWFTNKVQGVYPYIRLGPRADE